MNDAATAKLPLLPATTYCLGYPSFGRCCPKSAVTAYRAGYSKHDAAKFVGRCEVGQ